MATNDNSLQFMQEAGNKTKQIIDMNNQARQAEEMAAQERQNRFNDYYMRLNGRVSRDDANSILSANLSKNDYDAFMDNAKNYASSQPKRNLTNLLDFQNAIYDRQEARNELDMLNEKRRVQRETLGRGIGEVSAVIGDMIKASKGATVFPRQFDQQLAALDKRNQDAYKLYSANQQRIDQDRINALAAAQAQAAADKAKEQAQANKDRDFNEGVRQFDLTLNYKKERDAAKNQTTLAIVDRKNNAKDKKIEWVGFNGQQYPFRLGEGKAVVTQLIGTYWDKLDKDLLTQSLGVVFTNGQPVLGPGVKDKEAISTFGQAFAKAIVNGKLTDQDIDDISDILITAVGNSLNIPGSESTGDGSSSRTIVSRTSTTNNGDNTQSSYLLFQPPVGGNGGTGEQAPAPKQQTDNTPVVLTGKVRD